MRERTGICRRCVTLGLAVWFATTAALVQGPHRHAAVGSEHESEPNRSRPLTGEYAPIENPSSAPLIAPGPAGQWSRGNFGYCLACLFLKNCNERAVEWNSTVPALPADEYALRRDTFRFASPIVVSTSPRAPPVTIA